MSEYSHWTDSRTEALMGLPARDPFRLPCKAGWLAWIWISVTWGGKTQCYLTSHAYVAWLSAESGRNFILLKVVFLSGNVPSSEDSSIFPKINFPLLNWCDVMRKNRKFKIHLFQKLKCSNFQNKFSLTTFDKSLSVSWPDQFQLFVIIIRFYTDTK